MTRLSRLDEQNLETQLSLLEQQLQDLRAGALQPISGDSILRKVSGSGNTFDWSGRLPSSGKQFFEVTAVAEHMPAFWGQIYGELYVDSSTNLYDGSRYLADAAASITPITSQYQAAPGSSPNVKSWLVTLTGSTTRDIWIKFYVYGLDDAAVTVTALT